MIQSYDLKSVATTAYKPQPLAPFTTRLTTEQLGALRRCARGISLRFEAWSILNPLVDGGYAEKNLGGGVTLTAKGKEYIRVHAFQDMPWLLSLALTENVAEYLAQALGRHWLQHRDDPGGCGRLDAIRFPS